MDSHTTSGCNMSGDFKGPFVFHRTSTYYVKYDVNDVFMNSDYS
jgi:hypothetical protein